MEQIFKPRFAPRDAVDILIGVSIGSIQAIIILVAPSIAIGLLTGSIEIGILACLSAYCLLLLFMVRKISIGDKGIVFHRVLGTPKKLDWQEVQSIEEVSRQELVIKGWLWPLFPPREITACLSSTKHFRISWGDGFCYFPPKDIPRFKELTERYLSETRIREEHNTPDTQKPSD